MWRVFNIYLTKVLQKVCGVAIIRYMKKYALRNDAIEKELEEKKAAYLKIISAKTVEQKIIYSYDN